MTDLDSLFGERPLSTFYGALSGDQAVVTAVEEAFGSKAQNLLDKMRSGRVPCEQKDELNDILIDLLGEKGEPAAEFIGRGDFDEFPITVMRFGPVCWITAMEFDDIGFFDEVSAASEAAASNFEPFITFAAQMSEQDD